MLSITKMDIEKQFVFRQKNEHFIKITVDLISLVFTKKKGQKRTYLVQYCIRITDSIKKLICGTN